MVKPTWNTIPPPLKGFVAQALVRSIHRNEAEIEECRPYVPTEYLDSLIQKLSGFSSALAFLDIHTPGLGLPSEEAPGTPWDEMPPALAEEVYETLLVEDEIWERRAFDARRRYLLNRRDYCSEVSNTFKLALIQLGYQYAVLHRFH